MEGGGGGIGGGDRWGGGLRGLPFFLLDHGNPQSVSICQFVLSGM